MIRRGFWLFAGAVLGVTGYRKATRLARTLTGQGLLGGAAVTQQRRPVRLPAVRAGRIGPAGRQLAPQQLAPPQAAPPGLALPGQPDTWRAVARSAEIGPAARIATAAARATAAAGFVRDVRDGMAEYWDLHRSESDRTLGSQRDAAWPGDSQPGRREH